MHSTHNPYIEIRKNRDDQDRAFIRGTRLRVQDIYVDSEVHGKRPEEIVADFPHVSLAQVHAALTYSFENRDAILAEIRQDAQLAEEFRKQAGPGPLREKLEKAQADDAVPSR